MDSIAYFQAQNEAAAPPTILLRHNGQLDCVEIVFGLHEQTKEGTQGRALGDSSS